MPEHARAHDEQVVAIPALAVLVDHAIAGAGTHDGAAGVVRALIRHHGPGLAYAGAAHMRGVHGLGDGVDHFRDLPSDLVLVFLVVEGHAHQGQAERIFISRVKVKVVVAVGHHAAR